MTEENCQLLHIVELASDGVLSKTPISYILDALKETNIEAVDLYSYYGDIKNGNTNLLTSSIHGVFNNLDNYPQMSLVCKFCWTYIDSDTTHFDTFHPFCFCGPSSN